MTEEVKDAIVQASEEIIEGKLHDQFICDPIQGGAGTTANMNANEVIANRANEILGGELGVYDKVHPNDHVNMGQSTNDAFPTAGKIAALQLGQRTLEELRKLQAALLEKSKEFDHVIKMGGPTYKMLYPLGLDKNTMPIVQLSRGYQQNRKCLDGLRVVNMGASAVGTVLM